MTKEVIEKYVRRVKYTEKDLKAFHEMWALIVWIMVKSC